MRYKEANIKEIPQSVKDVLNKIKIVGGEPPIVKGFSKGVFLFGSTGVGKTYILHALQNHCHVLGLKSNIENWIEYLLELKSNFNFLLDNIKSTLDADVIMIDDLGAEKITDWSQEMLYMIVNRAYERNKVLFIATNLKPDEFREKYGDRILSRINEMCEVVELQGEDKRFS